MKLTQILTSLTLLLTHCGTRSDRQEIMGNWWADMHNGGLADSSTHYIELYFDKSSVTAHDEQFPTRLLYPLYAVERDSLYFGADVTDLKPFYKILEFRDDTLWLKANRLILKRSMDTIFLVRLPPSEIGPLDQIWTAENCDSLTRKVEADYHRRMWKYHALKFETMDLYDSIDSTGYWDWYGRQFRCKQQELIRQ